MIATFVNGYADGWFMAVKECFKEQLDIRYTEKVKAEEAADGTKKKRIVSEWTQGVCYCFAREHMLYDTPKAYLPWAEALQHMNLACKITSASPNELTRIEGEEEPEEKPKKSKKPKGYLLQRGHVNFKLFKPNAERSALVEIGDFQLTQSQFVEFLMTGQYEHRKTILSPQASQDILKSPTFDQETPGQ
jgi:hypothetical protein